MRAGSGSRARDGPCVSLSGLTSPLAAGSVSAMAGLPSYPAETTDRDRGVARWIPGLPVIVAGLGGRWSLRVGEPFQPGGQCSWTAPVTGPRGADLVLKIAFRFPGGQERDEEPRCGSGTVRLEAACQTESAYALLMERSARHCAGPGAARA
jgi:hypothetical protein